MKIASFNVNSVRVRSDLVCQYLEAESPDILGLQETKVVDGDFPFEPFADLGYEVNVFGQKAYHGVALLSKTEPLRVQKGFGTDQSEDQKRLILGEFKTQAGRRLVVINGYFPQGENRNHPSKFPAKQKFYGDLMTLLGQYSPEDDLLVMGDLNIAPTDLDIGIGEKNAKRWLQTGKCSFLPEERAWIKQLEDWGLVDSFRAKNPEVSDRYSWFDYRSGGYPDRGLRIDQIWVTRSLLSVLGSVGIDTDLREQERPSDHCVIHSDFSLTIQ